ncbi:hypothetical protein K435DRAFT_795477 [Dendrothele bispora CBS 962.96]|uniref:Uncharacterized protein n=1 Tax=Dendrothele bispora (strain CBS 962.96) TaxID=1314807 RepID=A0A4S8M8P2_DENBC|nr:hypothetical protein K435DRAFT_795477 [Dendrothele bispora CBS 962.96]
MVNQHGQIPPETPEFLDHFTYYYSLRRTDAEIAELMKAHYDTEKYTLGIKSVYRLRVKHGLLKTRGQRHTEVTAAAQIASIKETHPHRGTETIRQDLWHKYGMQVPRSAVQSYLNATEPHAVQARRIRRFVRRIFYAAGNNDIWTQDQHDKWGPRFGLWLHISLDPFNGWKNWLKCWWTNKNPRIVVKWYLEACREIGGIPLLTQSDPGNENNGVANCQTLARQTLDPSLVGTLQHRWKLHKMNPKPEAEWSIFRRDAAPPLENLFQAGVDAGLFGIDLTLDWSEKLDEYRQLRNTVTPRHHKHKILPHGPPMLIRSRPDFCNVLDFKIPVPPELFDELEAIFAPPDHEVFQLVPPAFEHWANIFYESMDRPRISEDNFWPIFVQLKQSFIDRAEAMIDMGPVFEVFPASMERVLKDQLDVTPGLNNALNPNEMHPHIPHLVDTQEGELEVDDVEDGMDNDSPGRPIYNLDAGDIHYAAAFSDDEDCSDE